ncbi:MAG: hypothetical protein SVM80_13505 [Halobacteriota archaeon]|nr:hypothetical protein [Halobacteriota archaeon]
MKRTTRVPVHTTVSTHTHDILTRCAKHQERHISRILDDAVELYGELLELVSEDENAFRNALTPEERKHVLADILRKRAEQYEIMR